VAQSYVYSVLQDCPGGPGAGKVNLTNLHADIDKSAIATPLDRIQRDGDVLTITFTVALSAGDKTLLDNDTLAPAGGIIAAHSLVPPVTPGDGTAASSVGAAAAAVIPGVIPYLGSFAGWNNTGDIRRNDLFFGRFFLGPGTYIGIDWISTENKPTTVMRFGVYADDGGTPPRPTGAILAQANGAAPVGITKQRLLFAAPLVVPASAYYWIGWTPSVNDHAVSITSHLYDQAWNDFLYCYKTGTGDFPLPDPVVGPFDANSDTPLPFYAIVMEGAP